MQANNLDPRLRTHAVHSFDFLPWRRSHHRERDKYRRGRLRFLLFYQFDFQGRDRRRLRFLRQRSQGSRQDCQHQNPCFHA